MSEAFSRKELAAAVGVSRSTLDDWRKEGCPMTTPEAVKAWRKDHKLPRRGVKPVGDGSMQDQLLAAQVAKVQEETRNKKMKNDMLAGKLYDADDVERDVGELTSMIRARLESVPDELSMEFPEEVRLSLTQRLKDKIDQILTTMSNFRLSSWDQPTVDESGESTESDSDADGTELEAV